MDKLQIGFSRLGGSRLERWREAMFTFRKGCRTGCLPFSVSVTADQLQVGMVPACLESLAQGRAFKEDKCFR